MPASNSGGSIWKTTVRNQPGIPKTFAKPVDTSSSYFFRAPNALCPCCGARVFFIRTESGGAVFFDALGPPWPKHPCTIVESIKDILKSPPGLFPYSWHEQGWQPLLGHLIQSTDDEKVRLEGLVSSQKLVLALDNYSKEKVRWSKDLLIQVLEIGKARWRISLCRPGKETWEMKSNGLEYSELASDDPLFAEPATVVQRNSARSNGALNASSAHIISPAVVEEGDIESAVGLKEGSQLSKAPYSNRSIADNVESKLHFSKWLWALFALVFLVILMYYYLNQ